MAEVIEFKSPTPAPPEGQKLPEANVVLQEGSEMRLTLDTTKPVEKTEERPAWLPEEFKTPEEFAEAYKTSKTKPAETKTEDKQPSDGKQPTPEQAREAATKAGLDMNKLSAEYAEKGELSAESLAALEKAGITKAQVDAYVEGQKAVAAQYNQRLADSIGGKEKLDATFEWARKSLTAEEIKEADAILQSGNESASKMLLAGLSARHEASLGKEPEFVGGRMSSTTTGPAAYESTAQMVADMNSAAYRKDPAFREKVMRRVAVSKF